MGHAELRTADDEFVSLREQEALYYTPNSNIIRKPRSLIRTSIDFSNQSSNGKLVGEVERISTTLMKAVQEEVHSTTQNEVLVDEALELSEALYEKYKEIRIKHLTKREAGLQKMKGGNSRRSQTGESLALEKYEKSSEDVKLRNCAYKDAWRQVLIKYMRNKRSFKYVGKSIAAAAGVTHNNYAKLYEDVNEVQHKFHTWTEPEFDYKTGAIVMTKNHSNLFGFSKYFQYGKGRENEIAVTIQEEMLHMVFFLNESHLMINHDHYNLIRTGNGIVMFDILCDVASSLAQYEFPFEEIQGRFATNYKTLADFCRFVVDPALERVNTRLNTSVEYAKLKKNGRKMSHMMFLLSDEDRKILRNNKKTEPGIENQEALLEETFGYFLAVQVYLHKPGAISSIEAYARSLNAKLMEGTYVFTTKTKDQLETEHRLHLSALNELTALIVQHDQAFRDMYYYDERCQIVRRVNKKAATGEDIRLGDNAHECLAYLKLKHIDMLDQKYPADDTSKAEERIEDFLPFSIRPGTAFVHVTKSTYKRFENTIRNLIEHDRAGSFQFDDPAKQQRFAAKYFVKKPDEQSLEGKAKEQEHYGAPSSDAHQKRSPQKVYGSEQNKPANDRTGMKIYFNGFDREIVSVNENENGSLHVIMRDDAGVLSENSFNPAQLDMMITEKQKHRPSLF